MRIGILCGEYPPSNHGGIGSFTKDLAEGLAAKGHQIIVFGIYYEMYLEINKQQEEVINNVRIIRLPFKRYTKNSYINEFLNRLRLFKFAQNLISIYSLQLIEAYDSTGMLPFKLKVPLITRLHGSVTYFGKELGRPYSRYTSFFEQCQIKKSDFVIGVSKYVLNQSMRYFHMKAKAIVVYNSLNTSLIQTDLNPHRKNYILYFGSILPKKGVEQLVRAMGKVLMRFPQFSLVMIGKSFKKPDGVDYTSYLYSLLPIGLRYKMEIIGHMSRDKLYSYISNSYCCVFPSYTECFAIAPMEAMALGKAVIYSKLHSGPELITEGQDGLLIDPDNVEEICEKISFLISNRDVSDQLGQNAALTIRTRFDYNNWLIENERLYFSLLDRK